MDSFVVENQNITGENRPETKRVIIPFDRYEVTVILALDNSFLGIEQISVNKSFTDFQKETSKGYHDVDEFYK